MTYITRYISPMGTITLLSDGNALTNLSFAGSAWPLDVTDTQEKDSLPVFLDTKKWLDTYFTAGIPDFTPPLNPHGTEFQKDVWQILLTIPYGQTMTYGTIAAQLAQNRGLKSMSSQAVGGAVGRNPIALVIPCHRVIGADGSLTGYAAGIERKTRLLSMERTHIPHF